VPSLAARGWLAAVDLQPWKARILLRLGLATTSDSDVLQALFDEA
jgi:L-asparaginase/Glu-tRNA(Gln) amidotransferase subunit D